VAVDAKLAVDDPLLTSGVVRLLMTMPVCITRKPHPHDSELFEIGARASSSTLAPRIFSDYLIWVRCSASVGFLGRTLPQRTAICCLCVSPFVEGSGTHSRAFFLCGGNISGGASPPARSVPNTTWGGSLGAQKFVMTLLAN